ncbi:MAG: hypothetical protein Q7S06_01335 [Nanoarchaeota archaeon]|nr:hypothetical protein [Nanoarchaeota archaeon]
MVNLEKVAVITLGGLALLGSLYVVGRDIYHDIMYRRKNGREEKERIEGQKVLALFKTSRDLRKSLICQKREDYYV